MVPADLSGFARRFWQGSTDHRGVPGAPGRVVTLVHADQDRCRGVAYRVPKSAEEKVLARLDHREKGGYDRLEVSLTSMSGARIDALVYLANDRNPNWLGESPIEEIADQVVNSVGPSGPNTEYVLELDQALRDLNDRDPHVRAVADAVRARLKAPKGAS